MAHQLGNLNDIHTRIGKTRTKGVAQIMEGKIVNSCLAASGLEAVFDIRDMYSPTGILKHEILIA